MLEDFPVVIEIPLAWGDMDAFQHVNNVMFIRYIESSRIAYFERLGAMEIMKKSGVGPILGAIHCRFRAPLTYPDRIRVGARVLSVEEDRFTMEHHIESPKLQKIAATGEGVIVAYDYHKQCKTELPPVLCDAIAEIEQKPLSELKS